MTHLAAPTFGNPAWPDRHHGCNRFHYSRDGRWLCQRPRRSAQWWSHRCSAGRAVRKTMANDLRGRERRPACLPRPCRGSSTGTNVSAEKAERGARRRAVAGLHPEPDGAHPAPAELRGHRAGHPRHREPVLHLAGPRCRGRRPGGRLLGRALQHRRGPSTRRRATCDIAVGDQHGRRDPRRGRRPQRPRRADRGAGGRSSRSTAARTATTSTRSWSTTAPADRAATATLVDQGFRRIACITGPRDVETATQRADGWRDAVTAAPARRRRPATCGTPTSGSTVGARPCGTCSRCPSRRTPSFVANNLMGVGALQVLAERRTRPAGLRRGGLRRPAVHSAHADGHHGRAACRPATSA